MRRLVLALLLLSISTPAPAATITQWAVGTVTANRTDPASTFRQFAVGEAVHVRFVYDLDPVADPILPPDRVWSITVRTGGGLDAAYTFPSVATAVQVGESLRVSASRDPWSIDLRFLGDSGTIRYEVDMGAWTVGFDANLIKVAQEPAPLPEPSSIVMGLVGATLAGLGLRLAPGRGRR